MPRFTLKQKKREGGWTESTIKAATEMAGEFDPTEVSHADFCEQLAGYHLATIAAMCPYSPTRPRTSHEPEQRSE